MELVVGVYGFRSGVYMCQVACVALVGSVVCSKSM